MCYATIFGQIKGLIEIHNGGKFHQYIICGCQVMYLQKFSKEQKVQFWLLLDGFSVITPPNEV